MESNATATCPVVQDLLPLYIDGLTSPETTAWIEEHLAACPDCAAAYRGMREGGGLHAPTPPPPTAEELAAVAFLKKQRRRTRQKILGVCLAAVALFCGVWYVLFGIVHPIPAENMEVSVIEEDDGLAVSLRLTGRFALINGVSFRVVLHDENGNLYSFHDAGGTDRGEYGYETVEIGYRWGQLLFAAGNNTPMGAFSVEVDESTEAVWYWDGDEDGRTLLWQRGAQ